MFFIFPTIYRGREFSIPIVFPSQYTIHSGNIQHAVDFVRNVLRLGCYLCTD